MLTSVGSTNLRIHPWSIAAAAVLATLPPEQVGRQVLRVTSAWSRPTRSATRSTCRPTCSGGSVARTAAAAIDHGWMRRFVEPTDVSIEYPVHLPLLDPDRQRIQCIVRAARVRWSAPGWRAGPHTELRGLVMVAATTEGVEWLNVAAQAVRAATGELGPGRDCDLRGPSAG